MVKNRTPDLKPDEFELTVTCPIGTCFAQCTYAFSKEVLKENANYRTQIKENIISMTVKQHEDGRHKLPVEAK